MDFLPNYIKAFASIIDEKNDKTKCLVKCTCGDTSFDVGYIHFPYNKAAERRFKLYQKEHNDALEKRDEKCNAFKKEVAKKHGVLISSGGFYKGKHYLVLAKQRIMSQDIEKGDFLKPDGCVAFLDITPEYQVLTSIAAKFKSGYYYFTGRCRGCGKEILLFDSRKYGYDGLCEALEGRQRNDDTNGITKTKKRHCENEGYKIYLTFSSTGKEDLITETGGLITEENWKDAFDWLTIDLSCNKCGKTTKDWRDIETM
jgi:hypothetical protein